MRRVLLVLATLPVVAVAAPATAAELRPVGRLAAAPGTVQDFAALPGGGAVVVRAPMPVYDPAGDVTVDVVRPGRTTRRRVVANRLLVDSVVGPTGIDLLVRGRYDGRAQTQELSLVRVGFDGTVRRVCAPAAPAARRPRSPARGAASRSLGRSLPAGGDPACAWRPALTRGA